jgi:hypothetical protein
MEEIVVSLYLLKAYNEELIWNREKAMGTAMYA